MSRVRVNYKSDLPPIDVTFQLNGSTVNVPSHNFVVRFFVEGAPGMSFECGYRDGEYINCTKKNATTLTCYIDNHKFGCGRLCCEYIDMNPNNNYADGVQKTVTPSRLNIILVEGAGDEASAISAAIGTDIYGVVIDLAEQMTHKLDAYDASWIRTPAQRTVANYEALVAAVQAGMYIFEGNNRLITEELESDYILFVEYTNSGYHYVSVENNSDVISVVENNYSTFLTEEEAPDICITYYDASWILYSAQRTEANYNALSAAVEAKKAIVFKTNELTIVNAAFGQEPDTIEVWYYSASIGSNSSTCYLITLDGNTVTVESSTVLLADNSTVTSHGTRLTTAEGKIEALETWKTGIDSRMTTTPKYHNASWLVDESTPSQVRYTAMAQAIGDDRMLLLHGCCAISQAIDSNTNQIIVTYAKAGGYITYTITPGTSTCTVTSQFYPYETGQLPVEEAP